VVVVVIVVVLVVVVVWILSVLLVGEFDWSLKVGETLAGWDLIEKFSIVIGSAGWTYSI